MKNRRQDATGSGSISMERKDTISMTDNYEKIKSICAMRMTGTAKLVAIAIVTFKTLDTTELASITGESARTVQKARAVYLELKDATGETRESGELGFAKFAKDANYNSPDSPPETVLHIATRATKESPTEILVPKVVEEERKKDMSEPSSDVVVPKKVAKARRKFAYTTEFEEFWGQYPDREGTSKAEAFAEWRILLPAEQHLVLQALPRFKAKLAAERRTKPDFRAVHACRFLSQRRWESFEPAKVIPIATAAASRPWRPEDDPVLMSMVQG